MSRQHGNILLAALLMLLLGACGPEQEATTDEPAEEQAAEESEELEMIELPQARTAEAGETLSYGFTADESSESMTSFLELAINDVHNFWAELLMEGGYGMPGVDYILTFAGETEETACTSAGATGPEDIFYCAEEDLIVFANEAAMNIWESAVEASGKLEAGADAGDFAVAAAMAHIYVHSLQGEWGWLPEGGDQERLVPAESTELNADCLTGVWAQSVYGTDMLDAGAVESAMETLSGAGQHDLPDEPAIGTPAERTDAFMTGFESGMASSCDSYLSSDAP